jgi:N-carbamoyl-L-amino-acid hydrolase
MNLRHDPMYVASEIVVFIRELSRRFGGHQVCTSGKIDVHPNLINVVPAKATLTLDIRNTDEETLRQAEKEVAQFLTYLVELLLLQMEQSMLLIRRELELQVYVR